MCGVKGALLGGVGWKQKRQAARLLCMPSELDMREHSLSECLGPLRAAAVPHTDRATWGLIHLEESFHYDITRHRYDPILHANLMVRRGGVAREFVEWYKLLYHCCEILFFIWNGPTLQFHSTELHPCPLWSVCDLECRALDTASSILRESLPAGQIFFAYSSFSWNGYFF